MFTIKCFKDIPTCFSGHITEMECCIGKQIYNLNDPILYLYFISVKCLNCSLFKDVFGFISNRNLSLYIQRATRFTSRFGNIVKQDPVKRLINENTYL